jgi:hypothetical protein
MKSKSTYVFVLAVLLIGSGAQSGGQERQQAASLALDKLELHNVKVEPVVHLGRTAMRVSDAGPRSLDDAGRLAVVTGSSFQDGTIEVNLTGDTAPDAAANLRGFVGLAFRISTDRSHFECFYLRPKNGRAEDQLQRNHSVQYISIPGFGWQKLRTDTPGKYESYVDLIPGQWTQIKIQVAGSRAQLYVNGAEQPTLIVNDLKQSSVNGAIALWIGPGSIAHFCRSESYALTILVTDSPGQQIGECGSKSSRDRREGILTAAAGPVGNAYGSFCSSRIIEHRKGKA